MMTEFILKKKTIWESPEEQMDRLRQRGGDYPEVERLVESLLLYSDPLLNKRITEYIEKQSGLVNIISAIPHKSQRGQLSTMFCGALRRHAFGMSVPRRVRKWANRVLLAKMDRKVMKLHGVSIFGTRYRRNAELCDSTIDVSHFFDDLEDE